VPDTLRQLGRKDSISAMAFLADFSNLVVKSCLPCKNVLIKYYWRLFYSVITLMISLKSLVKLTAELPVFLIPSIHSSMILAWLSSLFERLAAFAFVVKVYVSTYERHFSF
jgi:hypothetical protein